MKIHSNKQKCNKVNIISKDVCKLESMQGCNVRSFSNEHDLYSSSSRRKYIIPIHQID